MLHWREEKRSNDEWKKERNLQFKLSLLFLSRGYTKMIAVLKSIHVV